MRRAFHLFFILLLVSCQSHYDRLKQKITDQERVVTDKGVFNAIEGRKLYELYQEFIIKYPSDSAIASVHFQSGKLSLLLNEPAIAKQHFLEVITKHTQSRFLPEALVYLGLIEETYFHNIQEAERWYRMFISQFPEHPLAADIAVNIELLQKKPEEIAEYLNNLSNTNERKSN